MTLGVSCVLCPVSCVLCPVSCVVESSLARDTWLYSVSDSPSDDSCSPARLRCTHQDPTNTTFLQSTSALQQYISRTVGQDASSVTLMTVIQQSTSKLEVHAHLAAPAGSNIAIHTALFSLFEPLANSLVVTNVTLEAVVPTCGNKVCETGEFCGPNTPVSTCCPLDCIVPHSLCTCIHWNVLCIN